MVKEGFLGGLIAGKKHLIEKIKGFARHSGPALAPFNAWVISKSLETLAVRMDRHCENALSLSQRLERLSQIELVKYPFLPSHPQYKVAKKQMNAGGGIISFVIANGFERACIFLDQLDLVSLTAKLVDTRMIATHRTSTTIAKLSITDRRAISILPGLIRRSIGLEHVDDLYEDIEQALRLGH